ISFLSPLLSLSPHLLSLSRSCRSGSPWRRRGVALPAAATRPGAGYARGDVSPRWQRRGSKSAARGAGSPCRQRRRTRAGGAPRRWLRARGRPPVVAAARSRIRLRSGRAPPAAAARPQSRLRAGRAPPAAACVDGAAWRISSPRFSHLFPRVLAPSTNERLLAVRPGGAIPITNSPCHEDETVGTTEEGQQGETDRPAICKYQAGTRIFVKMLLSFSLTNRG
ncbi:unnamed protein product, partial [Urochloa humidicola]